MYAHISTLHINIVRLHRLWTERQSMYTNTLTSACDHKHILRTHAHFNGFLDSIVQWTLIFFLLQAFAKLKQANVILQVSVSV